jgi:hypothetical protein
MLQRVTIAIADEVERLRAAELDAKQRYYETVEESDLSATRRAAADWIRAGDALAEQVAMHRRAYSEYSQAADRSSSALTNNSENGAMLWPWISGTATCVD